MQFLTVLLTMFSLNTPSSAEPFEVFNLNVFDQLQGSWSEDFRERRMQAVAHYVREKSPAVVVFQEAKGDLPGSEGGGTDSVDAKEIRALYPYRRYVHEMTGHDGASYGYWIGAKSEPEMWFEDGFSFPGGVERKVQGVLFREIQGGGCLGILSLHMSYQNSAVRVLEARWILDWVREKASLCSRWLVVGDFNADEKSDEMRLLFANGLPSLLSELKPTVGAFNPIRRIYGENIPSKTIDWALGFSLSATAEVVLDEPYAGEWVSDHAGIMVRVHPFPGK